MPIIKTFSNALQERISGYEEIKTHFGFLFRFDILNESDISKHSKVMIENYKDDLETMEGEFLQFQDCCSENLKYEP